MLVFDQLKKDDPQLRALTLIVLSGLSILLAGLWWVQIVSARDYQESLENQSFRTVRIPAVRGSILDRNHVVLAENRPTYNVSMYLEELRKPFDAAYFQELARARRRKDQELAQLETQLGRRLTKKERKQFLLSVPEKNVLRAEARGEVASNVVMQISQRLQQPVAFQPSKFEKHYETRLALPYPLIENLDPTNIARFEEQSTSPMGVDLEVQSTRVYPYQSTAAHLLGYLKRNDESAEGEEAFFSYRLPDYRGELGIEFGFDKELRGTAGAKSVLVNNVGYRQAENVWSPAEAGHNVVLTIDLHIQQVAEAALRNVRGPTTRGAVVVMDVHTGDVLAMASSPTVDPNELVHGVTTNEMNRINDLHAQRNRATQENYAPGSIFKTVVGLALLEAGFNPNELYRVQENPERPGRGCIYVHGHRIRDTAPPGDYNFRRALMRSSNSYFITNGLRLGPERIIRLGQRFHLGERFGLPLHQETPGSFPKQIDPGWTDRKTANLSIGQDPVLVTPLQVAVLFSALANGGKVLLPRLVDRIEPHDPSTGEQPMRFSSRVRDEVGVSQRSMKILQEAMLADTEDPEGTGKAAVVPGLRICGKTGTAEIQNERNADTGQTTWFASFAPYENPRWAVVVMVEDGASGGTTCSPVAKPIYTALLELDRHRKGETMAKAY
ncbi:MAG TPA: penicillin-binding transpeptidase domain-containing protein [Verrucomicrobiae bacterium]|nr:penicillin-binding transpeptidase domain-containing protein [Verrucomicrobiae bacterium]